MGTMYPRTAKPFENRAEEKVPMRKLPLWILSFHGFMAFFFVAISGAVSVVQCDHRPVTLGVALALIPLLLLWRLEKGNYWAVLVMVVLTLPWGLALLLSRETWKYCKERR